MSLFKRKKKDIPDTIDTYIPYVERQLDIAKSQYTLRKITKREYDELVATIENNALEVANDHLNEMEKRYEQR